jgi:hypothetical protein
LSPPPRARWRAFDTSISLASRGGRHGERLGGRLLARALAVASLDLLAVCPRLLLAARGRIGASRCVALRSRCRGRRLGRPLGLGRLDLRCRKLGRLGARRARLDLDLGLAAFARRRLLTLAHARHALGGALLALRVVEHGPLVIELLQAGAALGAHLAQACRHRELARAGGFGRAGAGIDLGALARDARALLAHAVRRRVRRTGGGSRQQAEGAGPGLK